MLYSAVYSILQSMQSPSGGAAMFNMPRFSHMDKDNAIVLRVIIDFKHQ